MTIKKGDKVLVIAGREKGKQGTVALTISATSRVVVDGLNMRKRHLKPSQQHPKGGIIEMPGSMSRSNVMPICPTCGKATRVSHTIPENGKKFRSCNHCQASLDASK